MRLGFAVKVLGQGGLKETDSRRWQNNPHLSVSLAYLRDIFEYLRGQRIRMYRISSDLAPYLTLVQELADEAGLEMIEVAAAAARLARGEQPLEAVVEREGDGHEGEESGRVRLVIDAGRRDGLRPADVVGAIANEADLPGRAIGPIDIHDRVTFVDIPARHRDQVLSRMAGVVIRSRPVQVRVAVPGSEDVAGRGRPRPPGRRPPARASPARRSRRASRR